MEQDQFQLLIKFRFAVTSSPVALAAASRMTLSGGSASAVCCLAAENSVITSVTLLSAMIPLASNTNPDGLCVSGQAVRAVGARSPCQHTVCCVLLRGEKQAFLLLAVVCETCMTNFQTFLWQVWPGERLGGELQLQHGGRPRGVLIFRVHSRLWSSNGGWVIVRQGVR